MDFEGVDLLRALLKQTVVTASAGGDVGTNP
jgi:hypothetical protein